MSLFAKIMVVVNLLFAVVFLSAAGTFLGAAEDYKTKYEGQVQDFEQLQGDMKAQLDAKDKQIDAGRAEVAALDAGKQTAEGQLNILQTSNGTLQRRNEELNQSLQTLTTAQQDLQSKISESQNEIARLNGVLSDETAARRAADENATTLQNNLEREKQARGDAESAVMAAQEENNSLTADNDALQTDRALYEKKFGAVPAIIDMKPMTAKVQSADNKFDLYVLSVGKADGVRAGWEFTVSRNGQYVTMLVVDEVYDNYATARTKSGMKKLDVQPGDHASNK